MPCLILKNIYLSIATWWTKNVMLMTYQKVFLFSRKKMSQFFTILKKFKNIFINNFNFILINFFVGKKKHF